MQDVSESNLATLGIAPILNFLAKIFVFGYDFVSLVVLPRTCQIWSDFLNLELFVAGLARV